MQKSSLTGYPSVDKPWLKYYTREQIEAPLPDMTAYEYLKQQNAHRLEQKALTSPTAGYTYGQMFSAIDAVASALWGAGWGEKKILAMLPTMAEETFLFYGIDAAGGALCQLPPEYTAEGICTTANRIEASAFFVSGALLSGELEQELYRQTGIDRIVVIEPGQTDFADSRTLSWERFLTLGQEVHCQHYRRDPNSLLFLASTGGTTGQPKCVMLNDHCFNQAVHQLLWSPLCHQSGDRWLRLWPIFSASAAVAGNHMPLCAGMEMLLYPLPREIQHLDRMFLELKPNHLMMIPQFWDILEGSPLLEGQDLSFIKMAGGGGFGMTRQLEERVDRFFRKHNIHSFLGYGWGCTESAATISNRTSPETTKIGTSGAPMAKCVVAAFDPDSGQELPYGQVGELCAQTPSLMMGYYGEPELTANSLRHHDDGKLWLHSGDLGMVDADGLVTVTGRITRTIFVYPAPKVYPQELENGVSTVAGVQHVVFCQIPDSAHEGFCVPICFIVPDDSLSPEETRENVARFCLATYPDYAQPRAIHIRSSLPLTKVGKPNVLALEQEALNLESHRR